MYSRNHTHKDYTIFKKWWVSWGWPPIPFEFLPANSVVVCDAGDNPLAAVFLYKTDTPILWMENYISSKDIDQRDKVMGLLIADANKRVKEMGFSVIMSSVRHKGLARRLEVDGFVRSDENLTNYIKGVV